MTTQNQFEVWWKGEIASDFVQQALAELEKISCVRLSGGFGPEATAISAARRKLDSALNTLREANAVVRKSSAAATSGVFPASTEVAGERRSNHFSNAAIDKGSFPDHISADGTAYYSDGIVLPTPATPVAQPEVDPCPVCKFHWNQTVMPGEQRNRNCPHYDDREKGNACQKCGNRFRVDLNVPDSLWAKISADKNLLCGPCIMAVIESISEFDYYELIHELPSTTTLVEKLTEQHERLKAEVERLGSENELCRRAFETDDLLRLPEVGNLNALQVVKKLAELSDRLATARADAIGECVNLARMMAAGETFETGRQKALNIAAALEQLKGEGNSVPK